MLEGKLPLDKPKDLPDEVIYYMNDYFALPTVASRPSVLVLQRNENGTAFWSSSLRTQFMDLMMNKTISIRTAPDSEVVQEVDIGTLWLNSRKRRDMDFHACHQRGRQRVSSTVEKWWSHCLGRGRILGTVPDRGGPGGFGDRLLKVRVYQSYRSWCIQQGNRVEIDSMFWRLLRELTHVDFSRPRSGRGNDRRAVAKFPDHDAALSEFVNATGYHPHRVGEPTGPDPE